MKTNPKSELRNPKQIRNAEIQMIETLLRPRREPFGAFDRGHSCLFRISDFGFRALLLIGVALLLAGCATGPERLTVCPGKSGVEEALQTLTAQAKAAVPLQAKGEAFLTYYVPDKKTPQRQNLLLQLRFDPPMDIYILGGVSVDARVVVMGSNEKQFWLALLPKEVSSYYLGEWDEVRDFEGLLMSPQVVFEAFGYLAGPGNEPNVAHWTLANKGPYDILTQQDETGRMVKRVHVYACDYRIHKIEHFDADGKAIAVAQFGGYESVEGFPVPTKIRIISTTPDGRKDTTEISLSNPKTATFNDRQRKAFFSPPEEDRYENVYRYEAGQWVPQ